MFHVEHSKQIIMSKFHVNKPKEKTLEPITITTGSYNVGENVCVPITVTISIEEQKEYLSHGYSQLEIVEHFTNG